MPTTPDQARALGLPANASEVNAMSDAAKNDPLAVWWAMLTGQDSANSGGAGRMVSSQGGGFNPSRSANEAAAMADVSQIPQQVANAQQTDALLRAGANAPARVNPYSTAIANQARPAQEALLAQMRASLGGPSLAEMQGARAQGQNLQAALGAGAGRGAMLQARGIGAGLAGDTGAARLAEQMRLSQGYGGAVGGMRGADLGVSQQQSQAGLQTRSLDDAMRQFYGTQGARLFNASSDLEAERQKLLAMRKLQKDQRDLQNGQQFAQSAATTLAGAL